MPLKRWIKSANFAIDGILHGTKTQRHLRYHLYAAALVLILSYTLGISQNEFLIIVLAVIVVFLAELFNTAIEAVVDLLSPEHREGAKIAKDVAAGAVFTTAFGAAVVGYIILMPHLRSIVHEGFRIARHSPEDISLMALIFVLILVVIAKAYFGKGAPLRGGFPSGHSALAFSLWVSVTYALGSPVLSLISFFAAAAIAASRVITGIHTLSEVIIGSLMGAIVTFILFQLFL